MGAKRSNARGLLAVCYSPVIHTGLFAGVVLVGVMVGSLYVANRMPKFDEVASLRNLVFYGAFGVALSIPIARYLFSPWKLFVAGVTGWAVLAGAYAGATMFFENLMNRLNVTPFHLLMLGGLIYGLIAVMSWVASSLVLLLRRTAPVPRVRVVEVARQKQ
jgi:hypothetical protein